MKPTAKTLNVKFESLGQSIGLSLEPHEPGYDFIIGKLKNLLNPTDTQDRSLDLINGSGCELDRSIFAQASDAVALYYPAIKEMIRSMLKQNDQIPESSDMSSYVRLWVSASIGSEAC